MVDFDGEIQKHLQWREMIAALFEKDSDKFVPPQVVISDDQCQLGKWIYSSESADYAEREVFQQLKSVHKDFHFSAGTMLMMAQQGNLNEARKIEKDFYRQSSDVVKYLQQLKQSQE